MSPVHRHHLISDQLVTPADINFLINALIAWALFGHLAEVPLWGEQSIAGDILWTTFLLPFITCLIVNPLERKAVRLDLLPRYDWPRPTHPLIRLMPKNTFLRAMVFGLAGLLLFAPPAIALFWALGAHPLQFISFWAFKALFAAALAALFTPIMSLYALSDEKPGEKPGTEVREQ
jgi:hypothetical protein